METYSLYDLNEYIKRVIALNFPEPIWISCEISSCKNNRGSYYLDLVQQNETGEIVAQSTAVIWYKSILFLKSKLGDLLNGLLKEGVQVRLKVALEYNERYGLKLIVEDIDPTFTLGQMELQRQKILERLYKEEVVHLNKCLSMPKVIQRFAVISSEKAAGYEDFKKHLADNPYGYAFKIDLYQAALQGSNTEPEVVNALSMIKEKYKEYDALLIMRGGGSKLDLSSFDNFNIGYHIATFPIPVFTGIGHEIDQSIADLMAHTSLKTPTAVAGHIIDYNASFEGQISEYLQVLASLSKITIKNVAVNLESNSTFVQTTALEKLKYTRLNIDYSFKDIIQQQQILLKDKRNELTNLENIIRLSNPKEILKKGFSLVKNEQGGFIKSKDEISAKKKLVVEFYDGEVRGEFLRE